MQPYCDMPTFFALALALTLGSADWVPVSFGPRTSAIVVARLAVPCLGRVPPTAYQLTEAGVAVKVGGRSLRPGCAQAAVNAAMRYRGELPAGTAVDVAAYDYLRGVVLSHPTPEGVAELHRLTAEMLAEVRN
jgi:hypothetical protein